MESKPHGMCLFQTSEEHKRYQTMHDVFATSTRQLLLDAGLRPGMRVLDLGCGAGHVSLTAADIVGSTGQVVGLEKNPALVEHARQRAATLGRANVTILEADVNEDAWPVDGKFDMVTDRLVFFGLKNPLKTLKNAVRLLKSGGIVAMQEHDSQWVMRGYRSYPECPLVNRMYDLWLDAAKKVGVFLDIGVSLHQLALDAGLVNPQMRMEMPMGGSEDFIGYKWLATHMRLFEGQLVALGLLKEGELGADTLEQRLREEVVKNRAFMVVTPMISTWGRVP